MSEVVLEVLDLERAARFYGETLGFVETARSDDRAWFLVGSSRIGLWTPQVGLANGRGGVHVHFAFHLEDAHFDETVRRLDALGATPDVVSFEEDGRGRAVYVADPDGNVVEFWTWDVGAGSA